METDSAAFDCEHVTHPYILTFRPKLSSHVAYRHPSLVPRDSDIQNSRIFVGTFVATCGVGCSTASCDDTSHLIFLLNLLLYHEYVGHNVSANLCSFKLLG